MIPSSLTYVDVCRRLPVGPGHGYKGSWLSWFLRVSLAPFVGYEAARDVVVAALGPGSDYEVPNYYNSPVTSRRYRRPRERKA